MSVHAGAVLAGVADAAEDLGLGERQPEPEGVIFVALAGPDRSLPAAEAEPVEKPRRGRS